VTCPVAQEEWDAWIRNYLEKPFDDPEKTLNGSINKEKNLFRLARSYGIHGVPDLPIPPGQGVFLPHASYPSEGLAVIYEIAEGGYAASLRRVVPDGVDEIRSKFPGDDDKPLSLREIQVRYAGAEFEDPETHQVYSEPCHRFEHGFGQTWQIPESQLRYRGDEFATSKLTLYIGDRVTQVKFSQEPCIKEKSNEQNTSDEEQKTCPLYRGHRDLSGP
jgi:hypothetical protein